MFLDDELLQMCEQYELNTPGKVQQLNRDVCNMCEAYYKSKLNKRMTNEDVKIVMSRTFNLFDSFVRMAKKSDSKKLQILGDMFERHSFKKQFLNNNEVAQIYINL